MLPSNTEITLLLHSPSTSACWPPLGLLKRSIYEKEKTKLEGDASQDKKRKELLKKYGKANESWLKDEFNGPISTEK